MTVDQLKANLAAIQQQALRIDGMIQLLTQMIEQAEATPAEATTKD